MEEGGRIKTPKKEASLWENEQQPSPSCPWVGMDYGMEWGIIVVVPFVRGKE